jgi:hypothetical protein
MMPERIQQRRIRGWRKPENTVSVARPAKFGNPFTVRRVPCELGLFCYSITIGDEVLRDHIDSEAQAHQIAVQYFRDHLRIFPPDPEDMDQLRGKNLMCFCPLDQPCHADVLLEIANSGGNDA